jgi:hypothetical protein
MNVPELLDECLHAFGLAADQDAVDDAVQFLNSEDPKLKIPSLLLDAKRYQFLKTHRQYFDAIKHMKIAGMDHAVDLWIVKESK